MNFLERIHEAYVTRRRASRLCDHLAGLIPTNASVLDVGSGDGLLAHMINKKRPDVAFRGIDIGARPHADIPVALFDGHTIPFGDSSFDALMFVDVFHHMVDPVPLLREAIRVSRGTIVIKDLTLEGFLAGPTLRFMDWVGNRRHAVPLPYNYWRRDRWWETFEEMHLEVTDWRTELGLYPWPANHIFDRSLHFISRLEMANPTTSKSLATGIQGAP